MEIPPINGTGAGNTIDRLKGSAATEQDRLLAYRKDSKTGKEIEAIVSPTTGEIVDQIPAEALLRLQAELDDFMKQKEPGQ